MKLNGLLAYFCDNGHENSPVCEIIKSGSSEWPLRFRVASVNGEGAVDIYCDEQQLIAFKNSVISAYEAFRRKEEGECQDMK